MIYIKEGAVEKWLDYNGNVIHYFNPVTQFEYWQSFYGKNLTFYEEPLFREYHEYDECGNCIRSYSPDEEYEVLREFDELGNLVNFTYTEF